MEPIPPFACTAIVQSRLPHARALSASLAACQPGARLAVLVVDDPEHRLDPAGEPFDLLWPADAGITDADLHRLAFLVTGDDLAAGLAPALASSLLHRSGGAPLLVLAPETAVLASLDELVQLVKERSVVLLARLTGEVPRDGRYPGQLELAASGAFDPGVVGLCGERGVAFASWWGASLAEQAANDPPGGMTAVLALPGAQPLLDLAVGIHDPAVLRGPGYGLAYWNAHEGHVSAAPGGGFLIDDQPLRLAHLAGFDPWMPYLFSKVPGNEGRVWLSDEPGLRQLCEEHADRLLGYGYPGPELESCWSRLADGTPVDATMRRLARRAMRAVERTGDVPPDPFSPEHLEELYEWLVRPDPERAIGPSVPRYLLEIFESRKDLPWSFPRLSTVDAVGYRNWVAFHGLEEEVPAALRPALEASSWWRSPTGVSAAGADGLRPGVTLTGYLRAEVGVGEAARLVLDALQGARVAVSPVAIDLPTSRQQHPFGAAASVADRRINIIWMNAEHLLGFAALVGPGYFEGRYTVGGWAWETERLPEAMAANGELVDEIWVPSRFVHDAVEPFVDVPVRTFPHPVIEPPVAPGFSLESIGVPTGAFTYLFTFDFNSSFERKNPLGVLEAFSRAFCPGEGPVLVLKSVNGVRRRFELERLLAAAADRPDVVIVDRYLDTAERGALIRACDCYVSLHRAEGFGLGMAEAMALGRPVIATAYSGNLEFMDEQSAYLVPAERVLVGPHAPPYDPADHWGEPDLDAAAECLRRVLGAPEEARAKAGRAKVRVLAEHGRARAVRFLTERIAEIDQLEEAEYLSPVAAALRKRLG